MDIRNIAVRFHWMSLLYGIHDFRQKKVFQNELVARASSSSHGGSHRVASDATDEYAPNKGS